RPNAIMIAMTTYFQIGYLFMGRCLGSDTQRRQACLRLPPSSGGSGASRSGRGAGGWTRLEGFQRAVGQQGLDRGLLELHLDGLAAGLALGLGDLEGHVGLANLGDAADDTAARDDL